MPLPSKSTPQASPPPQLTRFIYSLRRAHFKPRKRGRKAKTEGEKRGGKGGGDWPPMQELKENWLREVEEFVTTETQLLTTESNTDDDEQFDNETDLNVTTATVSSSLPDDFAFDTSSAFVENMPLTSSFGSNADQVNFEYDTAGIGAFDMSVTSDLLSQATGLYTNVAFGDNVFFDESVWQPQ
jgi:hypothetical protein